MYTDITPLLTEAERYLTQKDYDRAAAMFEHANRHCGGSQPLPMVGLARIAVLLNRLGDATTILDAIIARFPRCAEALTTRGVLCEAANDLEEAMSFHSRALLFDASLGTAHANLGRCYGQLERWDLSAASLRLAIQHGADDVRVKSQLGTALFRAGRKAEATRVLALTVNAHPNDLDAIVTLSDVLVEAGSLGQAAALLANAAVRLPNEAVLASRSAAIALRLADLDAASREAFRTTALAPKDEEAWLFAAVIETMRLQFDSAARALKTVLRLNPANWRAHHHLGGLADALRDVKQAKACYRAATLHNPRAWEPLNNLAVILLEEGTLDGLREARSLLDRAIREELTPDALITRYNLALACLKMGDWDATRRHAGHLLKLSPPDHPMATEAQRLLRVA